jgi:hypothetical protein
VQETWLLRLRYEAEGLPEKAVGGIFPDSAIRLEGVAERLDDWQGQILERRDDESAKRIARMN